MLSVKALRDPVALRYVLIFAIALTLGCSDNRQTDDRRKKARDYFRSTNMIILADDAVATFPPPPNSMAAKPAPNPQRNAYFGDMHVHTKLFFDATAFGTTATLADAYRYAQGEAIKHPGGFEVQLARPLDFYAVTDHAMFLGLINDAIDTNTEFSKYELSKPYHNMNDEVSGDLFDMNTRNNVFNNFTADVVANLLDGTFDAEVVNKVSKSAWQRTIEAANAAYQPGKFTTFVGYEFTPSTAAREALHRNVIFRGGERLPAMPFSRLNSLDPDGLWRWMDVLRDKGVDSLAIPHNSNGSNGMMFAFNDWAGNPVDQDYVKRRARNEPLVEITQAKGTSETHPFLSPNDEWADFEIFLFAQRPA